MTCEVRSLLVVLAVASFGAVTMTAGRDAASDDCWGVRVMVVEVTVVEGVMVTIVGVVTAEGGVASVASVEGELEVNVDIVMVSMSIVFVTLALVHTSVPVSGDFINTAHTQESRHQFYKKWNRHTWFTVEH